VVRSEKRYEIAWQDLDPKLADDFASGWRPTGADGETARALIALGREDAKAAAALVPGNHPLARHLKTRLQTVGRAPEAPPVSPAVDKAWPPTREQVAACFRGKLKNYDPDKLAVEIFYEFDDPKEGKDWELSGAGQEPGGRMDARDGRLFVRGEQVWALAPGMFTTVAAKTDFALLDDRSTDAALAVVSEGRRSMYNFHGLEGGKFSCLEKWDGAECEWRRRKAISPFAGPRKGRIGLACGNGRIAGYVGSRAVASDREAPMASVQVGVFTRRSIASFDNITISGNLDEKWLRRAIPPRAQVSRPERREPDAVEFRGHLYKFFRLDETVSWHEAQSFCEERGGHLVTITSPEEQFFAAAMARRSEMKAVWIGLTNEGHAGEWKWVTGEPLGYKCWARGEPNDYEGRGEHWGALLDVHGFAWNDDVAEPPREVGFICEW